MIRTKAPGKLYVAGEYAVVEPGFPAILAAVDRYLTVQLTESAGMGRVHSSRYGHGPITWVRDDCGRILVEHNPLDYVTAAMTIMERLREERHLRPRYYDLRIESELDDPDGRKFGLGSSAAVTVAVIEALDLFYGMRLTRMDRFRLALLATIGVAPRASGGDVAASTFGGFLCYTSPDREVLLALSQDLPVSEVLRVRAWDQCGITPLSDLASLRLRVGWTGSPASTEGLVSRVSMSQRDLDAHYAAFLAHSREAVTSLLGAWSQAPDDVLALIRRCRRLLQHLGELRGTMIETSQLRTLCDLAEAHGGAAKPSGAGGGDCGIVLLPSDADERALIRAWRENGILPLDLRPAPAAPLEVTR